MLLKYTCDFLIACPRRGFPLPFSAKKCEQGVIAVNLSRPIGAPRRFARFHHPGVVYEHFAGGPCQEDEPIILAHIPEYRDLPSGKKMLFTLPAFARASPEDMAAITGERFEVNLKVRWGVLC